MPLPQLSNRGAAIGPIGVVKFGTTTGFSALSNFADTLLKEKQLQREATTKAEAVEALRLTRKQEAEMERLERIRQTERKAAARNVEDLQRAAKGNWNGIQKDPNTGLLSPIVGINTGTSGDMAQLEAAEASFIAAFIIQTKGAMQKIAIKDSASPKDFLNNSTAYMEGILDKLPEEFRPAAMQEMQRSQSLYSTQINEDYAKRQKSALGIDLSNIINDKIEGIEQLVTIQGSKASMAEIKASEAAVTLHIEQGLRSDSITTDQADKAYDDFRDRIRRANIKFIANDIYDKGGAEAVLNFATNLKIKGIEGQDEAFVLKMAQDVRQIAQERKEDESYQVARDAAANKQADELVRLDVMDLWNQESITGERTLGNEILRKYVKADILTGSQVAAMKLKRFNMLKEQSKKYEKIFGQFSSAAERAASDPYPPTSQADKENVEAVWKLVIGDLPLDVLKAVEEITTDGSTNAVDHGVGLEKAAAVQYVDPWNPDTADRIKSFVAKHRLIPQDILSMLSYVTDVTDVQRMNHLMDLYRSFRETPSVNAQIDSTTSIILERIIRMTIEDGSGSPLQIRDQIVQQMQKAKKNNNSNAIFSDLGITQDEVDQLFDASATKAKEDARSFLGTAFAWVLDSGTVIRNPQMDAAYREVFADILQKADLAGIPRTEQSTKAASDTALANVSRRWTPSPYNFGGGMRYARFPPLSLYPEYKEKAHLDAALIEDVNALESLTLGDSINIEDRIANDEVMLIADERSLDTAVPSQADLFPVGFSYGKNAEGREIVVNARGGLSTQQLATFEEDGKWFSIPTIFNGKKKSNEASLQFMQDNQMVDPETGREVTFFDTEAEAIADAKARSDALNDDPAVIRAFNQHRAQKARARSSIPVSYRVWYLDDEGAINEIPNYKWYPPNFAGSPEGRREDSIMREINKRLLNADPSVFPDFLQESYVEADVRTGVIVDEITDEVVDAFEKYVLDPWISLLSDEHQRLGFHQGDDSNTAIADDISTAEDEPRPTAQSGGVTLRTRRGPEAPFINRVSSMPSAEKMIKGFEVGSQTLEKTLTVFWEEAGKKKVLTVGYGHKVLPEDKIWDETIGPNGAFRTLKEGDVITQQMADDWYKQDLAIAKEDAKKLAKKWDIGEQPPEVMNILMQMAFQMGINRVGSAEKTKNQKKIKGFEKMFAALKAGDYEKAADEMLNSDWATQSGPRVRELAAFMRALVKRTRPVGL